MKTEFSPIDFRASIKTLSSSESPASDRAAFFTILRSEFILHEKVMPKGIMPDYGDDIPLLSRYLRQAYVKP